MPLPDWLPDPTNHHLPLVSCCKKPGGGGAGGNKEGGRYRGDWWRGRNGAGLSCPEEPHCVLGLVGRPHGVDVIKGPVGRVLEGCKLPMRARHVGLGLGRGALLQRGAALRG